MKKLILSIFIFSSILSAQQSVNLLSSALKLFNEGKFLETVQTLGEINPKDISDVDTRAAYYYYGGKSYIELKEYNAAVFSLNYLVNHFKTSSLREDALYSLGKLYYEIQDYEKALNTFKTLGEDYAYGRYYGSALFWAGESASQLDFFEEAKSDYLDAISMSATNNYLVESIYSVAKLFEKNKKYDEAISYYDELLSYYSDSKFAPFAQLRIGKCYFNLPDYDNAILELTDPRIKKLPRQMQLQAQYYIANSYFRMEEYDKALDIYRDLLKNFPGEKESNQIRFNQAWINFQSGMFEDSYRIFNLLSKLANGKIAEESLYWSAEAKRYNGELELAELIYKRFIKLYPKSKYIGNIKFNLAVIEFERNNIEKAKKYLIEAITGDDVESAAKSHLLLGQIFIKKKQFKLAREHFEKAADAIGVSKKTHYGGMLGLGVTDFYLNKLSSARKFLTDLFLVDKSFEKDKVNFYLAETHFALGDYQSALEHYKRVSDKNPTLGVLNILGKAYCFFNMKNYSDAAFYFNELVNKFPHSPYVTEATLRLADSYYGTKNFSDAIDLYDKVFSSSMKENANSFAYYQYGKTLLKVKRYNNAISILRLLQKKFPFSEYADNAQYLIGWTFFQKRAYSQAVREYQTILNKYPKSNLRPVVYYSIGDAYYNMRNYTAAVTFYKRLLDNYSETKYIFDAINGIEYCYTALGAPEKATKIIDDYILRNPSSKFGDKILIKKGEIYFNANMYSKAKLAFKEFIATYPNSSLVPSAYYRIGKSALKLGQFADAVFNLNRVVTDYPNSESGIAAAADLAKIYLDKKEDEKALEVVNSIINKTDKTEKNAELIYYKGLALIDLGRIKEVYEAYNSLISNYPKTIFADKAKLELGILELSRNSFSSAESVFAEIGKRRTDDVGAKAQYLYGETLFTEGKFNDAVSAYVRVKTVFGSYKDWVAKSELRIADAYVKMHNKRKAKQLYKNIYRKHRYDSYGREAKAKLRRLR